MSDYSDSTPFPPPPPPRDEPPMVVPARVPPRPRHGPPHHHPPPPPPHGVGGRVLLVLLLLGSIGFNLLLLVILAWPSSGGSDAEEGVPINERHYSHSKTAKDKIAVVRVEGLLVDEAMSYAHKQIDKAAKDDSVKAVVLRINSPGGTITASDELHRRLTELRDGSSPRYKSAAKPIVVSMSSTAASGGYYIAMPSRHIFAERTTITGSIGVYASLPNVSELANKNGVKMELIKAGDVKGSGSMFQDLSPQERQVWQDMVSNAYGLFLRVVEEGRPHLKGQLTKNLTLKDKDGKEVKDVFQYDSKGNVLIEKPKVPYKRQLADGGIYTAEEALQHKLIDSIGYLDDAVKESARLASLTGDYQVVVYERPVTLLSLFGGGVKSADPFDFSKFASAAQPRVWYLAPNCELAGYLSYVK
jgi:protease-4